MNQACLAMSHLTSLSSMLWIDRFSLAAVMTGLIQVSLSGSFRVLFTLLFFFSELKERPSRLLTVHEHVQVIDLLLSFLDLTVCCAGSQKLRFPHYFLLYAVTTV